MNITKDIRYIGVNDHQVDLFEGQYVVPNGMAYNSYAILDEKTAIILYQAAADMGDANAARWMGWRYLQGRGVKKNRQLAEQCFTIAAIQGDPRSQEALKQNFGKTVQSSN